LIFASNIETIKIIANKYPLLKEAFNSLFTIKSFVIVLILMLSAFFAFRYFLQYRKKRRVAMVDKKESLWTKFLEGVDSISRLDKKWQFLGHTAFIFLMWLGMLYVVFLAYAPTAQLSIRAGMLTFLMGGLAMLVPVQGGIGPWHAMVSRTLENGYGIAEKQSEIFAFIAHTTTNLVYIILGGVALIIVFVINSGKVSLSSKKAN
jgi:hypothetical protein